MMKYRILPSSKFDRRFFLWSAGKFVATAIASSCTSHSQKPQAKQSLPKQVRIGFTKGSTIFLILKARQTLEQRFQELGIGLQWSEFQTIPILLEAMNAGSLDFAAGVDTTMVFAQANGVPFVYTSAMPPRPEGIALIVRADSPIKSLADFKGKKVGYGIGWSLHYFIVKALESVGLKPEDIETVKITGASDGIAAFESKSIDVLSIWDPFYASLQKKSNIRTIVDAKGFSQNRPFTVATSTFANKYPNTIKLILEQLQAAADWANQNQPQTAKLLAGLLKLEPDIVEVTLKRQKLGIIPMDAQVIAEQQAIADTFFNLKLLTKQVQVKNVVASNPQWFPKT